MNKKTAFLFLVMSAFISFVKSEDPLETTKPDEIEGINNLYDKIAGTTWIHHYKSGKFPFTFGTNYRDWETDRKSTRLNSSHLKLSRMPSSA